MRILSKRVGPSVCVLLYMLDSVAAVACVVMGLEATEDRKVAAREGGDKNADGRALEVKKPSKSSRQLSVICR